MSTSIGIIRRSISIQTTTGVRRAETTHEESGFAIRGDVARKHSSPSSEEIIFQHTCELAGVLYRGVLKPVDERGCLVLFDSPRTQSTLGCWQDELSVESIRAKVTESDQQFERGEMAARVRLLLQKARQQNQRRGA
jgi:hypothetical protein